LPTLCCGSTAALAALANKLLHKRPGEISDKLKKESRMLHADPWSFMSLLIPGGQDQSPAWRNRCYARQSLVVGVFPFFIAPELFAYLFDISDCKDNCIGDGRIRPSEVGERMGMITADITYKREDERGVVSLWVKCRKRQTAVSNCIDLGSLLHMSLLTDFVGHVLQLLQRSDYSDLVREAKRRSRFGGKISVSVNQRERHGQSIHFGQ
jgi:hypothetical protein